MHTANFAKDVLADSVTEGDAPEGAFAKEQNINGEKIEIAVIRK